MHVMIHHDIGDPHQWDQGVKHIMSLIEQGRLPSGLKPLQYLPSTDGRQAFCVWETSSLGLLQQFLERETGGAARNKYFEIKVEAAIGLPKGEEPVVARAA